MKVYKENIQDAQILKVCAELNFLRELIKRLTNKDYYNCYDICINLLTLWDANNSLGKNAQNDLKIGFIRRLENYLLNEEEETPTFKKMQIDLNNWCLNDEDILKEFLLENVISSTKNPLISDNIMANFKKILNNFVHNIYFNKITGKTTKYIPIMITTLEGLLNSLEAVFNILNDEGVSSSEKEEFTLYLKYLAQVLDCLVDNKKIDEDLGNKANYYFEAITFSVKQDGDITCLCFDGEKDEYKRMREKMFLG